MFVNTAEFSREAQKFKKYGYYIDAPKGSSDYMQYWSEQQRRRREGYSVGGVHITGHHYNYLNFSQITLTEDAVNKETVSKDAPKQLKSRRKVVTFPDFWDGDYHYFTRLDQAAREGRHFIAAKARRKGYEQPDSETVYTPGGPVAMGNLKVGDEVLTPYGVSARVLEVYPQGLKRVYEVQFRDGRKVKCGIDHLWAVSTYKGQHKVVTTRDLMKNKLVYNPGKRNQYYHYYVRNTSPVPFPDRQFTVDPYVLGVLLGDGSLTQNTVLFSSDDEFIVNKMRELLPDLTIKPTGAKFQYRINGYVRDNKLFKALKELGVCVHSHDKFIPEEYKYGSIAQRIKLIQGLMDTDGTCAVEGNARFITTSERLADDLIFVLNSLGVRNYKATQSPKGFGVKDSFVVSITTSFPVFSMPRKSERIKSERYYDHNKIPIVGIVDLGYEEESSCILIDHPEHLYLTAGFIPTHNSYKNGAVAANEYDTQRNKTIILGAYEKKYLYPKGIMSMASDYLNFYNEHTAWVKRRQSVDKVDHKKASYFEIIDGVPVERGYKSQIIAITFQNKPDAARGKDASLVFFEEAGTFENLKAAYWATRPTMEDGVFTTGMMVIFGTGGDMEGGTLDFESMFYDPEPYNLLTFENVWDEGATGTKCGFFFPVHQSLVGYMDKDGNSDLAGAEKFVDEKREEIRKTAKDPTALTKYITEYPKCPREAFIRTTVNMFPTVELSNWRNYLYTTGMFKNLGVNGMLKRESDGPRFIPSQNVIPMIKFPHNRSDIVTGCVITYQSPFRGPDGKIPNDLYFIAHDPYAHDTSEDGSGSLGAAYVIKRVNNYSKPDDCIVASYVGRPETQDEYNKNLFMLAEYYNARIGFENDRGDVIGYAKRMRLMHWLLPEVEIISKDDNIKIKKLGRNYGISVGNEIRKAQGEIYLRDWLITPIGKDENGRERYNYHRIYDIALLDELIRYYRKGNFDRVSAMIVGMYHMKDMFNRDVKLAETESVEGDFWSRPFFAG